MALVDRVNRRARSGSRSKTVDVTSRPAGAPSSVALAQQYMSSVFGAASKSGSVAEVKPKPYRDLWHRQAFPLVKAVPEVSYVVNMMSDLLGHCAVKLQRRKPNTDEWEDSDDQRGLRVLRDLHGPIGGVGELLRQGAVQAEVIGEAFLYGDPVLNDAGRLRRWDWSFKSMPEVLVPRPGDVRLVPWGTNVEEYKARPGTYVKRCLFNPDPEFSLRATSPIFNCLPLLTEMVSASQVIDAILRSQIHAGMFFMPQEVAFGPTNEWDSPGTPATGFDEAEEELQEFMSGAMNDGTSVNRVQPLLMWGPGVIQRGDKTFPTKSLMGLVPLSREFDDFLHQIRQELIERLGKALNIEPEVLTGMGKVNHFCADDQTEVMTRDGWKRHTDLRVGDDVLTLNTDTGMSEWGPVEYIYRADVVDEPMVLMESPTHSSLTTLDHKWPTAGHGFVLTKDLDVVHSLMTGASCAGQSTTRICPMKDAHEGTDGAHIVTVPYTGTLWCPTTVNHTWLARRKGKVFYTGNSGWLVDEAWIRRDVVPLGERILNWLTSEHLRPMLQITQGMNAADAEWFRYALDPAPIQSAPDKTNSATAAYNMLACSTESWLDYMGMDPENDLPSGEEYIVRCMERLVLAQPSVAPNVMPWLVKAKGANVDFGDTFDGWTVGTSSPGGADLQPQGVNGRQSGPGAPPSEADQTGRLAATGPIVTDMLTKTADQVLLRAVRTASTRLVTALHAHDESHAKALMTEPPSRLLTVAGHKAVQTAHTSISALFEGAFDELAVEVVNWLVGDLVNRGVPAREAQQRATVAATELTTQLASLAASTFDRPLRVSPNGSHVSDDLVRSALTAGDVAEIGLPQETTA